VVSTPVRIDFGNGLEPARRPPVTVIDADTHLYEGRGLWAEHADPDERHLALRIADDKLGCSDFPHAEGLVRPLEDYRGLCGPVEGTAADRLYGGNISWLLGSAAA
jgi:hypothetical protein